MGSDPATIRNFNNVLNEGMHADALRANPGYEEGQPCRLIVCHSGVSGVGQQLSDELGVPVLAPNDRVGTDKLLGPGQVPEVFNDAGWTQLYPRG